jgi:HK97 family phage prohead protease
MEKETKTFRFEIKEFDDAGQFSGYLATFGNVDGGGDVVDKGAFKKTLKENDAFPLLWGHSAYSPGLIVGAFHGKEDGYGLKVDGEFFDDEDSQKARRKVKRLYERGIKIGLSMGYKTLRWLSDMMDGQSVRRLQEVRLNEGSLTLWPMNELARVDAVKMLENDDEGQESKPFPNEHSARLKNPGLFDEDTFRRKKDGTIYGSIKVPATIAVIWGKLKEHNKPEDNPIPQTLRFPTDDWTVAEAKKWLKDNEIKYLAFEPAEKAGEHSEPEPPKALDQEPRIYSSVVEELERGQAARGRLFGEAVRILEKI